jgi:uncharacterized protein (TIGR02145 family)
MKAKNRIWLCLLIGLILILINSCKKNEEPTDKITDKDGNVYTSVTIGTQTWMIENLKTTRYNDNTPIPNVKEAIDWTQLASPAYCWYFNIVDRTNDKGILYNWYAVNTKKLCPAGWHVPSDAEWKELELYIGMDTKEIDLLTWRGDKLSESLKANYGWYEPGTNDYDFSAVPSGFRVAFNGHFEEYDHSTDWWCTDEEDQLSAFRRGMVDYQYGIYRNSCPKNNGISVRCIKN